MEDGSNPAQGTGLLSNEKKFEANVSTAITSGGVKLLFPWAGVLGFFALQGSSSAVGGTQFCLRLGLLQLLPFL